MEYGAHLPIIAFDERPWSLVRLQKYAAAARSLGFASLSVNDHLAFGRPWLDSLTALAAVLEVSAPLRLVTSVALPVIRGPVPLAKALAALDILSGGRVVVGLGPGSSARDYAAVGVPFAERWRRFDESVRTLRALLVRGEPPHRGRFYAGGEVLTPLPSQIPGPPIWIGSWGSEAGLRRAARLGDGWLASAYNTTPARFAAAWTRLRDLLRAVGKDPTRFPNGLSTAYCYVTEDRGRAGRLLRDVLGPALNRPAEALAAQVLIGPLEACAERVAAYRDAGLQRLFVWPIADEEEQLEIFHERLVPLVAAA